MPIKLLQFLSLYSPRSRLVFFSKIVGYFHRLLEVTDGHDNPIGFIKQSASMFETKYEICTPTGVPTLKIKQQRSKLEKIFPACTSSFFPLTSYDGKNSIGGVLKEHTFCEMCSGEQKYKVQLQSTKNKFSVPFLGSISGRSGRQNEDNSDGSLDSY